MPATNAGINYYNVTRDFLPLTGFLIAYFTYLFQRRNDTIRKKEETRSKQINLIDTITISLERIDTIFESLKIDAREKPFYSLSNIFLAKPLAERMQSIFSDIIVFSDDTIKEEILKNVDLLLPLIDAINALEQGKINDFNKLNDATLKYQSDLQLLKIELLKYGITIDSNNAPQFIDPQRSKNKKMLKAARNIINQINQRFSTALNYNNESDRQIKEKRTFFAMQIIDVQTRLRELKDKLLSSRDELQGNTVRHKKSIKLFGFIKIFDSTY